MLGGDRSKLIVAISASKKSNAVNCFKHVLSPLTPLSLGIESEKITRYLVEPNLCNSTWSYTATCCGVDWRP